VGLHEKFIKEVGNTIQPGNTALFLLVRESTPDKVMDELKKYKNVRKAEVFPPPPPYPIEY
jgi:uncharacterized membrane protein